ncbi:MAG: CRISPR-associated endonuclease Cas1 [Verrucomicrobiae bacterium]|nr:CRISPR-associated endonuclease Cas1 [Verrucomicrobiae bacterium]
MSPDPKEQMSSKLDHGFLPGFDSVAGGERKKQNPRQSTSPPPPDKIPKKVLDAAVRRAVGEVFNPDANSTDTPGPGDDPETSPENKPGPQVIPIRMLNEFVYCQRLFYYEFVEGVFVENADTVRGKSIHKKVDSGKGEMPATNEKRKARNPENEAATSEDDASPPLPEVIHSRSVQMGSERLGVTAKMDLVEVTMGDALNPSANIEVCPVDYKAGAPKEGNGTNELWDADKMQLGLQALILRDNGYVCQEGVIYYRATRQRVRLPITPELEEWILSQINRARDVMKGPLPPPLVDSPKCVRCSLAPVCLPDETTLLAQVDTPVTPATQPRRLIAARDDERALYLNTQGYRVGCKDEVLLVRDKDKVVEEVRLRDVSHVALFGNIQITTQAIQSLCEMEVPVTYFSMGGWFYGMTRGHALKNIFTRIEQFRLAQDPVFCLGLAKKFVNGKIRNHRTLLMRNHVEPPEATVLKLKRAAEDALDAQSLDELLGIEGAAASLYFQAFGGMIKEEEELPGLESSPGSPRPFTFNFTTRNRRPPTDPVNALLSLAYSVLAKDCTLAALSVGFDPYVGFYHQPRFGRPALGLDLMEEFRPLVAESAVLNCINNGVVSKSDFVRAGNAVNLTAAGRKKFFQMYEQRMSGIITHPVFDYKVSYRRAMELQARLLAKSLTGDIADYVPFTTR